MKFVKVRNNNYDIVLLNIAIIRTIEIEKVVDRAKITDITGYEYFSLNSYADFMKEVEI